MKGKYPLTKLRLHKVLFELLEHPEVSLSYTSLVGKRGHIEFEGIFPPTDIKIKVDANDSAPISTVIHELLHVILYELIVGRFSEELEEEFVLTFEKFMYEYIMKSPERMAKWNKLIESKLERIQMEEENEEVSN